MSLLSPTPGDLIDRMSILNLKIKAAEVKGIPNSHFVEEFSKVKIYLFNHIMPSEANVRDVASALVELGEINKIIWDGTEEQKNFGLADNLYADISRRVVQANIQRANLVRAIDAHFGIVNPPEKV